MILYLIIYLSVLIYESEGSCLLVLRTNAQVERRLLHNGFHRELETAIWITSSEDLMSCTILIKDVLPSGAYYDPSQLRFIQEIEGLSYYIPQLVNVELPEHYASKVTAYFFEKPLFYEKEKWFVNFTVPIHFRYHRAHSGEIYPLEAVVEIPHPSIYLSCDAMPDTCQPLAHLQPCFLHGKDMCEWFPLSTFSTNIPVSATIPVGDTDLLDTVLLATTTITCGTMLLILSAIFKKNTSYSR